MYFIIIKSPGIDKATLTEWLKHFATDKLINTKGTTYKALSEEDKAGISSKPKAIALMMANTSLIKRPVWDFGDGKFYLGWNEKELSEMV